MMAFAHPDARIEALTTVAGNVSLERTTANACTILDVLEQDVPVFAGCSQALVAKKTRASVVHGEDGLGDSGYSPSMQQLAEEHAVHALIRLAKESPGALTLIAIGPLTNVALAIRLDPELPTRYKNLIVMGGAIHGRGNATPAAEFNTYADPEAAAIVFDAWKGMTLLSWETTVAHVFNAEQVDALMAVDSPRGEFFRRITQWKVEFFQKLQGRQVLHMADGLAVAVALEPDIVTRAESHHVQVELAGVHTRGQTVVDWNDRSGKEPKVKLILELDKTRFFEMMMAGVQ